MKSLQAVALGFLWVLAVCSLSPMPALADQLQVPAGSATIAEVKGEVLIQSPKGETLPTKKGQLLPAETNIQTGKSGTILLTLSDGSQVLVKSNGRVVLKSPEDEQGNYLQLLLGKILAKVQKRIGQAPSFSLGTPTAVITVRGTQFSVDVDRATRTTVQVFEGLVSVSSMAAPREPVLLKPGFSTVIEPGQAPQIPRGFEGPEGAGIRGPGQGTMGAQRGGTPGMNQGSSSSPGEGHEREERHEGPH